MSDQTPIPSPLPEPSFDIVMRGYDRQQVDAYLALVRDRVEAMERAHDPQHRINEIIELAQQQANEVINQAREEARRLVAEAERRTNG